MSGAQSSFDALAQDVRRVDEDRWLAARFAPTQVYEQLVVLYALNNEIARTAAVVKQAAIGDIRLAWWREAIAEIYAGKLARAHPVLQAFAAKLPQTQWPLGTFEAIIDARAHDLEAAPFANWEQLSNYVDATAGNVMRLALQSCSASYDPTEAALAWGHLGIALNGRNPLLSGEATQPALLARAREAYAEAKATRFPAAAFPAIGYVALTRLRVRALERGHDAPLLARQLKLIAASALDAF